MKKMKFNINWSNVVAFIMMILTIAVGSLVITWLLNIYFGLRRFTVVRIYAIMNILLILG